MRKAVKVALKPGGAGGGHGAIEAGWIRVIPYTPIRFRAASAAGILTLPALPAPRWNAVVATYPLLTGTLENPS
jgi:hypothetical protein